MRGGRALQLATALGLTAAAALGGLRCMGGGDEPSSVAAVRKTVEVRLVEYGEVVARDVCPLTARVGGDVTWVEEEGTAVKPGQPVLRMSTEGLDARSEDLRRVREELAGQLATKEAVAASVGESGKLQVRRAEIDLDLARLRLEEALARPTPGDRKEAELRLAAARLRAGRAEAEWEAQQALVRQGCAAEQKVKAAALALMRSRSDLARAEASSRETLSGTAAETIRSLRAAVRRAELELAQIRFAAEADPGVARGEADVARARLDAHLKRMERHQRDLESATLVSPMDGVVALVDVYKGGTDMSPVQIGEHHKAGRELLKVADVSRLRVRVLVNERDVLGLRVGQRAAVWLTAFPGTMYPAEVAEISPYADDKNRSLGSLALDKSGLAGVNVVPVVLDLEVPEGAGRPRLGASAEVEIVLNSRSDALTVPLSALLWAGGRPHVVLADAPSGTRLAPVEVAFTSESDAVIQSGLSEGDRVLLHPPAEAAP